MKLLPKLLSMLVLILLWELCGHEVAVEPVIVDNCDKCDGNYKPENCLSWGCAVVLMTVTDNFLVSTEYC